MPFDHEKLDVYGAAIEFVALASQITAQLPRGWSMLADQLKRAAMSIVLNIAEGAGEYRGLEKARFYRIASRSATECAAIIDICRRLTLTDLVHLAEARAQLLRIVSMLTKLARRHQGSVHLQGLRRSGDGDGNGDGHPSQSF